MLPRNWRQLMKSAVRLFVCHKVLVIDTELMGDKLINQKRLMKNFNIFYDTLACPADDVSNQMIQL